MEHPYHNEHGFAKVAEAEVNDVCSWSVACIFRDKTTGRLYGDWDAGCSCYGPFEETCELGALKEIVHEREAAALLDNVRPKVSTEERMDFVRKVREALLRQRAA